MRKTKLTSTTIKWLELLPSDVSIIFNSKKDYNKWVKAISGSYYNEGFTTVSIGTWPVYWAPGGTDKLLKDQLRLDSTKKLFKECLSILEGE